MKTQTYPVVLTNHPQTPAIKALVGAQAVKRPVVKRSFLQLVTRQGVPPDRARQLLGMTK